MIMVWSVCGVQHDAVGPPAVTRLTAKDKDIGRGRHRSRAVWAYRPQHRNKSHQTRNDRHFQSATEPQEVAVRKCTCPLFAQVVAMLRFLKRSRSAKRYP